MATNKTPVAAMRMPIAEYVALMHEAEQQHMSISAFLLVMWRERNARVPIDTRLRQIELAIAELRTDSTHKFQRLADGLNQIILERR